MGKTTLAASICKVIEPKFKKVLLLDIDLGASAIGEDFPTVDVVEFKDGDIKTVDRFWDALVANDGDGYDAVIIDTFTFLQQWKVKSIPKGDGYSKWEAVLEWTLQMMKDLHSMTPVGISCFHTMAGNTIKGTEDEEFYRLVPALQGSAKMSIGAIPDIIGYVDVAEDADDNLIHTVQFQPSGNTITGNRFKRLPQTPLDTSGGMARIYEIIAKGL